MNKAKKIALKPAMEALSFLSDRTPQTSFAEAKDAFATLASYRDGAIFIGYYAGTSEWERHGQGDELVFVVEGTTRLFLLEQGVERSYHLGANELLIVPQNTWHRFETSRGVKILTVTPQPTDHSLDFPQG